MAQMVGMGFAPESPVWLKSKHRRQEAVWAEKRLLGGAWAAESETNSEIVEGSEAAENGEADLATAALLDRGDQVCDTSHIWGVWLLGFRAYCDYFMVLFP